MIHFTAANAREEKTATTTNQNQHTSIENNSLLLGFAQIFLLPGCSFVKAAIQVE